MTSSSVTKLKPQRNFGITDSQRSKHTMGNGPKMIMGQSSSRAAMHESAAPSEWPNGSNGKTGMGSTVEQTNRGIN